jgi:hypothetical protein
MRTGGETLSFVLPVALGHTGRPGSDLERMKLLLDSLSGRLDPRHIDAFLVITRPQDFEAVSACVRSSVFRDVARVIDENSICAELAADPDTFHEFPTLNKGWYRQQMLKLGAARHLSGDFYVTLDSDVVFTQPFVPSDLISDGRSVVNTQTPADFKRLFTHRMAEDSTNIRLGRDQRAEELLQMKRTERWFYGETPVVLSVRLARDLLAYIEQQSKQEWAPWLLENTPWTEYSLYFTYAEGSGQLHKYHRPGDLNSVFRMTDSLWYPADDYRTPRSLGDWSWTAPPSREGIAVVVQSYLGYEPRAVREKLRAFNVVT